MTTSTTVLAMDEYNALTLSAMADCFSPEGPGSAGDAFLLRVRNAVSGAIREGRICLDGTERNDDGEKRIDVVSTICDGTPSVYTPTRWAEFVDLRAYQEDARDGEWPADLTDAAAVALIVIAERLADALIDEAREQYAAEHEGDDEDQDDEETGE
jgi:hypothetical protein